MALTLNVYVSTAVYIQREEKMYKPQVNVCIALATPSTTHTHTYIYTGLSSLYTFALTSGSVVVSA